MPLGTGLQRIVVLMCLVRAALLLAGVPLSMPFQFGLLVACGLYAATQAV